MENMNLSEVNISGVAMSRPPLNNLNHYTGSDPRVTRRAAVPNVCSLGRIKVFTTQIQLARGKRKLRVRNSISGDPDVGKTPW